MGEIGYRDRVCSDQGRIEEFLGSTRVGVLGLAGDAYPYALPMNFVWDDGAVYFHGMGSGKKVELLAARAPACFTVFREDGTVADSAPCHVDTAYFSVVIFGEAEKVTDLHEASHALQRILEKYAPGRFDEVMTPRLVDRYRSGMDDNAVGVYRIVPVQLTAKHNEAAAGELYPAK
jgi:nitroimidazol reductase NimA-like FMN-containing flavoprotein (pyridoxamine 5'-phosphate oxidase superfamily)